MLGAASLQTREHQFKKFRMENYFDIPLLEELQSKEELQSWEGCSREWNEKMVILNSFKDYLESIIMRSNKCAAGPLWLMLELCCFVTVSAVGRICEGNRKLQFPFLSFFFFFLTTSKHISYKLITLDSIKENLRRIIFFSG